MAQGAVAARRPTVVRHTIAAALLAVGTMTGALSSCGKPAPEPTATSASSAPAPTATEPSPTPTASPSPTPPAKPAGWTSNDDAGALAAAQYFMDLYNYVIATGDLTEWKALAAPDCGFCSSVATTTGDVYGAGGHIEGGAITVSEPAVVGRDEAFAITTVEMRYSTDAVRDVAADGAAISSTPAESAWVAADLYFTGSGWQLYGVDSREDSVR